ncbi:MAG TPA: hypothetical protein VFV17_06990 [Usitatibacteraceae bacterium]|nr:hypothetical protein [Usitatibacteraceae bacterium]
MARRNASWLIRAATLVGGALLAVAAQAAGLSPIKVQSGLGQPFLAEIALQGLAEDDLLTAQARMAAPEEYEKARIGLPHAFYQFRVVLEQPKKGPAFLRVTSSAPINEPSITLMVEFSWRGGRIVQKYPVLLDPPKS